MPCSVCQRPAFLGETVCLPCRVDTDTRWIRVLNLEWSYAAIANYVRFRQMLGR